MSEYRQESQTLLLLQYFRQHPALVLSIAYLLLTLCGILYSASFFKHFDIAILKLVNISDLLIVGISEPSALVVFSIAVFVALSFDWISQKTFSVQARWREKPKSIKRSLMLLVAYTPKRSESIMFLVVSMFFLYAYFFIDFYGSWQSNRIKDGKGDKIMVTTKALGDDAKQLTLLGSTSNFLLTYDNKTEKVTLLPMEGIEKLTDAIPPKNNDEE